MNILSEIVNDDPALSFSPLAAIDVKETWAMGRDRSDLMVDLRQFPFDRYNIFYFQIENGVEIYRVIHSSRNTVQVFNEPIDEFT